MFASAPDLTIVYHWIVLLGIHANLITIWVVAHSGMSYEALTY